MPITVAAIEDGSLAMRGAVETLRRQDVFAFLGVFAGVDDLVARPEDPLVVVLIDPFAEMPGNVSDLARVPRPYAALVMSAHVQLDAVRAALRNGARGYISKEICASTLLDAIRAVAVGGIYLGPLFDLMLAESSGRSAGAVTTLAEGLTPRERDVLVMVAQGLTHKQIGTRLNLSKATIDTYIHRVRQKAGSGNKADLTRLAIDLGLMQPHVVAPPSTVGMTH
jgi:two-component system, NarL family, nitrate/nitrite response regulator NarL